MPNPNVTQAGDGCIVHAGILASHGGHVETAELTSGYPEAAKERFIKDVINELSGLAIGPVAFPCGDPTPVVNPVLVGQLQDLADEKKYPAFHRDILGHYRDIARKLDKESNFSLLPICDPVAFALAKFDVKIKIPDLPSFMPYAIPNLPALALKVNLKPPELAAKLPSLIKMPEIPPKIALDLPTAPQVILPGGLLDFKVAFIKGFPDFMVNLFGKMPDFIIKLISLELDLALGDICKLVQDAKLFGDSKKDKKGNNQDIIMIVARKVLARKITELTIIHAMSQTVGTSPGGLVGNFSKQRGYDPSKDAPPPAFDPETVIRTKMVEWMTDAIDLHYGNPKKDQETSDKYASTLFYSEYADDKKRPVARSMASAASGCAVFARSCLYAAGASYTFDSKQDFNRFFKTYGSNPSAATVTTKPEPKIHQAAGKEIVYDYFTGDYPSASGVSALVACANASGAFMNGTTLAPWMGKKKAPHTIPPLKRGDILIVSHPEKENTEHVIVVYEDYSPSSGKPLVTVEGGQIDHDNDDKPTAIMKCVYVEDLSSVPDDAKEDGSLKFAYWPRGVCYRMMLRQDFPAKKPPEVLPKAKTSAKSSDGKKQGDDVGLPGLGGDPSSLFSSNPESEWNKHFSDTSQVLRAGMKKDQPLEDEGVILLGYRPICWIINSYVLINNAPDYVKRMISPTLKFANKDIIGAAPGDENNELLEIVLARAASK